jgi:lipoprotein-anchoring transpeptidase ErfK/SrfK
MGRRGRHAARKPAWRRWLTAVVTAGAASAAVLMIAAHVTAADSAGGRLSMLSRPGTPQTPASARKTAAAATGTGRQPSLPAKSAAAPPPPRPAALTARDHSMCPPAAAACVDLTRHLTWLQSGGKVTYGPVQMEPGPPGSLNATPQGTFAVTGKGGPDVISNTYHEPMPWAVFFGSGGIAFHAGSLTVPSHGCVHLTMASAHYYNEHLAIGAEVVVF